MDIMVEYAVEEKMRVGLMVGGRSAEHGVSLMSPQGVMGAIDKRKYATVIAFYPLEDRLVKQFDRQEVRDCICPPDVPACACGDRATLIVVTRQSIRPSDEKINRNPRSRGATPRIAYCRTG